MDFNSIIGLVKMTLTNNEVSITKLNCTIYKNNLVKSQYIYRFLKKSNKDCYIEQIIIMRFNM